MGVRAAVLTAHGEPPRAGTVDEPAAGPGEVLVDVAAAPITPLDVLCASGTSYFGPPPLPYVPGVQGVGVVAGGALPAGTRVWFATDAGMRPGDGSMAARRAVPLADVVPLAHDVPPVAVAGLGLSAVAAWAALTWRGGLAAGERVVVLGAGGVVGQVGVQVARLAGASHVVAACRGEVAAERALRLGADAAVLLDTADVDTLAARFAAHGEADLVLDPLCGAPATAALRTLAPGGRLVNLGSSAGAALTVDSALLRSRSLRVLGYTNTELSPGRRSVALDAVLAHAAAGRLTVDLDTVPLEDVAAAWRRQSQGLADRRIVLVL